MIVADIYQKQSVNLLANQFRDSATFHNIAKEISKSFDNVNDIVTYMIDNLDVYKAKGVWLDLIGTIVGQSREIPNAVLLDFFGFNGNSNKAFGLARFWDGSEPFTATSVLADAEYRKIILSRINYNYGDVTLPGIAESLSILFNTNKISVKTKSNANISIYLSIDLTQNEINLVNAAKLIIMSAGVGLFNNVILYGTNVFGFKKDGFLAFGQGPFVQEF